MPRHLRFLSSCALLWSFAACSDSNDRARDDASAPRDDGAIGLDASVPPPPPPDGSVLPDGSMPDPDTSLPPDDASMPDVDVPPVGIAHSFDCVATLTPDPSMPGGPGGELPAEHRFTMRLETVPEGLQAIAGRAGTVGAIVLRSRGDGTFTYEAPAFSGLSVGLDRAPGSCGGAVNVFYERFELRLERTATASVGRVVGAAAGRVTFTGGDVIWDEAFSATLEGPLDTTPPDYRTNVLSDEHHVLDGFVVSASEPLPGDIDVALADIVGLVPIDDPMTSAVARFTTPSGTVLPWGSALSVVFSPGLVDLAGNAASAAPEPPPRTLADPGLLAQDGFESTVRAYRAGDVIIIEPGVTAPAPIAGAGALFVGPGEFGGGAAGGRFTARLAVASGATRLRARFRTLGSFPGGSYYNYFRIYAPNVSAVENVRLPDGGGGVAPSGLERLPYASEVIELDVPLPAGATGEVVLDIDNRLGCGGLPPPPTGLLIDDLRIE